jgi:P-type Cu+ transporter
LEGVDTLVIDKTGTLTEGRPAVSGVAAGAAFAAEDVLRYAAAIEQYSEHPLAKAVVRHARERGVEVRPAADFRAEPGGGVTGTVDGRPVRAGSAAFVAVAEPADPDRSGPAGRAGSAVYVAVAGQWAGRIVLSDPIKSTTPEAVAALHRMGLRIVMLTGDNPAAARQVADRLGIDEVAAGVMPDEKLRRVRALRRSGRVVAMAGDGINDAPALAEADVGMAMGTGTDAAMESAGITLVKGDLRGVVKAIHLSRAAMRNIRQNLFWAIAYNALGVPVAAGVFYPWLGVLLSPMLAAAAMSFSSVSVIANALRLRRAAL